MFNGSSPLNGDIEPPVTNVPEWKAAMVVVDYLRTTMPGPASAQTTLCMAMVMINHDENHNEHSDEEFIGQIARSLRLLCNPPQGAA